MDCAPLNLAHFHERRAEKFLRHHRYEDAHKAIETSLLYVQDAYKNALIDKSIEVLNTQKWEYERKLRQIKMRKQQHERMKLKEIVPSAADSSNSMLSKPENSATAVSISKAIDKTIEEFDAKFSCMQLGSQQHRASKENQDPKTKKPVKVDAGELQPVPIKKTSLSKMIEQDVSYDYGNKEDFPSLAPLELPSFDFNEFTIPALANIDSLMENFRNSNALHE